MQVRRQTPTGPRSLPVCRGTRPSVHHGKVVPGSNKDSLTRPVNTAASGALPSTPQHCETSYSPSMLPYMVDESGPVQQDVFPCPLHKVGSKDPALLSQHERMTRAGGFEDDASSSEVELSLAPAWHHPPLHRLHVESSLTKQKTARGFEYQTSQVFVHDLAMWSHRVT